MKQDGANAAAHLDALASSASSNAEALVIASVAPEACQKVDVLRTLAGVKSVVTDVKRDDAELSQLSVLDALASIKQQEEASLYARKIRRFFLAMASTFHARVAANNISAATNIADHADDVIQLMTRDVMSNKSFSDRDRVDLVKIADKTRDDIKSTAKSNLAANEDLMRMLVVRASDLYNIVKVQDMTPATAASQPWKDFKARFESALQIKVAKTFTLPTLADRIAILNYDIAIGQLEAEAQTFEAQH